MADNQNTNGNTAATEKEAAEVSGFTGSAPRFRTKPGSVFPPRRKLVQTRMKDAFVRLLPGGGGSDGNGVSRHRADMISRVLPDPDYSPAIDRPNGHN